MDLKHGGLENLIMNVIWQYSYEFGGIMDVSQAQDKLNRLNTNKKWAYTTVKTVLDRLTEKGFLQKVKSGKKYCYKSLMKRDEMAEKALKKVALDYFQNDYNEMVRFASNIAQQEKAFIYVG